MSVQAKCARCNNLFEVPATGRPRLYCSNACRQADYRERAKLRKRQTDWVDQLPEPQPGDPLPESETPHRFYPGIGWVKD